MAPEIQEGELPQLGPEELDDAAGGHPAADATAHRRGRLWLLAAVGAAAAVVVAVVILVSGGSGTKRLAPGRSPRGAAEVAARFRGIPQQGLELGNPTAPVTLVEYADLKCPTCQFYTTSVLPQLVDRYVRTGKIKMVLQLQTFVGAQFAPGDSARAARMALAVARQNKLWQFADLFYLNQQDETASYASDSFVTQLAKAIPGVDVRRALAERSDPSVARELAQADSAFNREGFTGTPSFQLGRTGGTLPPLRVAALDVPSFAAPIERLLGR